MLIEYLRVTGIVSVEGNTINLIKGDLEDGQQDIAGDKPKTLEDIPPPRRSIDGEGQQHPFIEGLLKTLPKSEGEWTLAGRIKWLQAASNIFGLIYTDTSSDENEYIEIAKKKL